MSLTVEAVIVNYSGNSTEDYKITLKKFLEVEESNNFTKSDGSWTALLGIFVLMSLSSYIIYMGMEDESEIIDSKSSKDDIESNEELREMAVSQETDEEKEN